ncbi:MAG: hypothetical protein ACRYFS_15680 [Janthinobacterium lividum]
MDYDSFDNDDPETSDENYSEYVGWLSERTAKELRQAKGDAVRQRLVLCQYYKRGEKANLAASELIDFLAVSSPSIFDMADYTDDESDTAMVISDGLTDDEVSKVELQ